ncbi:hypothetical protein F2P81_024392 [Scophthalmus maximus]|uniref:Uncharacterized protein n=1 Tax=Scophthalmus maximus TaxID=52904 RepID=A0A6A4RXC7_SCOMX|nr:hypothetical protein F2P81_024392 [Scophthalmus maximus]
MRETAGGPSNEHRVRSLNDPEGHRSRRSDVSRRIGSRKWEVNDSLLGTPFFFFFLNLRDTSCKLPSAADASVPANTITALSPAAAVKEFVPAVEIFSSVDVLTDPGPHDFHHDLFLSTLPRVQILFLAFLPVAVIIPFSTVTSLTPFTPLCSASAHTLPCVWPLFLLLVQPLVLLQPSAAESRETRYQAQRIQPGCTSEFIWIKVAEDEANYEDANSQTAPSSKKADSVVERLPASL